MDALEPKQPSVDLIMESLSAYQRTAALQTAIELDVFTAIAEGNSSPAKIAARSNAAERGIRILCDYLVLIGHLQKSGNAYQLTRDSAAFLSRKSPHCIAPIRGFLCDPFVVNSFKDLTSSVRRGGAPEQGSALSPAHPIWVEFARSMAPLMAAPADLLAQFLKNDFGPPSNVLDVAAGHGLFGIALARLRADTRVTALDWPNVLDIARENAKSAGVEDRLRFIAGNALDLDLGSGYDAILVVNFLHHFDAATIVHFMTKVRLALAPAGRAVILDFIPNEDRITPPRTAAFSLVMLASTPGGEAYPFSEYRVMLGKAGFKKTTLHPLIPTSESVVIAE